MIYLESWQRLFEKVAFELRLAREMVGRLRGKRIPGEGNSMLKTTR